jgi:hypothetical protein
MVCKLIDISTLSSGYPFRGKIVEKADGSTCIVQMRNVNLKSGIHWDDVIRTDLPGKEPSAWLEDGDIVFTARGRSNYAILVQRCLERSTLSPHFFQIRPDASKVIPGFLAWQLNQQPAQKYFAMSAEGSAVVGIRKAVLENTPLQLPAIEQQQQIMKAVNCWEKQQVVIQEMAENHQELMKAFAVNVLNRSLGPRR